MTLTLNLDIVAKNRDDMAALMERAAEALSRGERHLSDTAISMVVSGAEPKIYPGDLPAAGPADGTLTYLHEGATMEVLKAQLRDSIASVRRGATFMSIGATGFSVEFPILDEEGVAMPEFTDIANAQAILRSRIAVRDDIEEIRDPQTRGDHLLEAVLSYLQASGYDPRRAAWVRDRVWADTPVEPGVAAGRAQISLLTHCASFGLELADAAEDELTRMTVAPATAFAHVDLVPTPAPSPAAWLCRDLLCNGNVMTVFTAEEAAKKETERVGPYLGWAVSPVYHFAPDDCPGPGIHEIAGLDWCRDHIRDEWWGNTPNGIPGYHVKGNTWKYRGNGSGTTYISDSPAHARLECQRHFEMVMRDGMIAGARDKAALSDLFHEMARKHGKPDGTQYEEGAWDMAMRLIGKLNSPLDPPAEASDRQNNRIAKK